MSDDRKRRGGGKFQNHGDDGLALSEFENETSSPNRRTPPPAPRVADLEEHRRARQSRERPPIGLAGMIGLGALVVASSFIFLLRRGKRRPSEPEPEPYDPY